MTKTFLLATTATLLTAGAATASSGGQERQAAQAPAPTGPSAQAPLVDTAQRGVLVFTPDFFASQRPNTALDMVNRVPGLEVNDGDGGRGFEGAVGNILINGSRPASKNDTGSSVLSRTLAAQVERIELIRGGAPGIDMQGFSVVVNVILKSQSSREHVLQLDSNIFEGEARDLHGGRYQFTARDGERTWGFVLSDGIGMSDSNGVGPSYRRDATGTITRAEDFFNDQYGGGSAIRGNYAAPMFGGKVDLTARYGVNDWNSFDRYSSPTSLRESSYLEDSTSGEVGAVYTRPLEPGLSLETRFIHEFSDFEGVSAAASRVSGVDAPAERFTSIGDSSETILRGLLRWERSDTLTFEGGGEVAYNMLDTQQAFERGGVAVPLPSASVLVEETRGEVFGKATWRISPTLSTEGGVRVEGSTITQSGDADQDKTFTYIKPRLQATWTPWAQNQIRVRFEREVGQLDFGQFAASAELSQSTVLGGNVDLEPQERWISEIAYERRFWGEGVFSLTYRHDEISNVIDRIPLAGGLSAIGNIGDGTLDQVVLNLVVPTDRLGVAGGRFQVRNTWNSTEVTDPTTGEARSISGLRPSQPNFSFTQDVPSWRINWTFAYLPMIEQYTYSPDQVFGFEGSDFFQAAIEYKPTDTLSLRIQLNVWNDFNVYRTVYASRTSPRPISYVETREIDPREFISLRLRKTF